METLSQLQARRLALVRAGLLNPRWTGLPTRATGGGERARKACHEVIRRFGYLQLDTVSVAGARSHAIVLLSRLEGLDPELPERLLQPGEPLFEYWGHEASWLPIELYPVFAFRRREFRVHPWWGDLLGENPELAGELLRRLRDEGPLRSLDLEGKGSGPWWGLKKAKKVISALWSAGDVAVRERKSFQRFYDLTERVIPEEVRQDEVPFPDALETLLLKALDGHGWAQTGTLTNTWRLKNLGREVHEALHRLVEKGKVVPCAVKADGRKLRGWIRTEDLELAGRLPRLRPERDRGVLLSPFDPVLWDRRRVWQLFDFEQVLEIFKPAEDRIFGYYCLPVLAGDRLVGRCDLKADREAGTLRVLATHYESDPPSAEERQAVTSALERYGGSLGLAVGG